MSLDLKGSKELLAPVASERELVEYIRAAEKPASEWRVGVEHEKLGLEAGSLAAVPYHGPGGIRDILDALARSAGAAQHTHAENGMPIALLKRDSSVTLEPGGQLELSGAPVASLAEASAEIAEHLAVLRADSGPVRWLGAGYRPFGAREDVHWMPKGRYAAMRASLGPRGRLALDMMLMTATVQANLDWSSEADLREKLRTSTAVSPLVTALFANSPIVHGRDSGLLDFRYQVWRETDAARCGMLEQMVQPGWGYERYVDWALDVPMLFVRRGAEYLDARGQTFRQWLATGKLAGGEELAPLLTHWADHLSTVFPEVRVKRVLELRGADMVPPPYLLALPAIWMGLLYDGAACSAAWELVSRWTWQERLDFQAEVAKSALSARGPRGVRADDLARELVALARQGLAAWGSRTGHDERAFLDPIADIAESGQTLAQQALAAFNGARGDPQALVRFWQIA